MEVDLTAYTEVQWTRYCQCEWSTNNDAISKPLSVAAALIVSYEYGEYIGIPVFRVSDIPLLSSQVQ